MGVAERREREREKLRTLIVEAARDLVSEQGLPGLSMRAIADRIEYSPATIYLHFKDKEELVLQVVHEGHRKLDEVSQRELRALPPGATGADEHRALGRGYVKFALENPAYFRVMFELPGAAHIECPPPCGPETRDGLELVVDVVRRAAEEGSMKVADARRTALMGWGLVHGLVSLYLSGHLAEEVSGPEGLLELVEETMMSVQEGWGSGRGARP